MLNGNHSFLLFKLGLHFFTIMFLPLTLMGSPCPVYSAQPIDVLRSAVDKGIQILKDPQYKAESNKVLQEGRLWGIVQQVFDFKEFSRRSLGRNWRKLTPHEKKEFTEAFTKFLRKAYLGKAQERYKNEEVLYLGQQLVSASKALVKIKVVWQGVEIPLDIRMLRKNGNWKVYDVVFLGVSVIKNYRAQFNRVLLKQTPAQLIEQLKRKIARLEK